MARTRLVIRNDGAEFRAAQVDALKPGVAEIRTDEGSHVTPHG
jgi:hypothetical protein